MRATYLHRREPFAAILTQTLTAGWSAQYDTPVEVRPPGTRSGSRWLLQPLLNGYYVPHAGRAVRTFLRDNFRHTPVRRRAAAQWLLGTALAHPLGLRLTGRPGFVVRGDLPAQASLLVVPGSQRLRVFDFSTGRTRVFLKTGFDRAPLRREIEVRGGRAGPFPPLSAWSPDADWFEEPILDAVPLARVPSRAAYEAFERDALALLEGWLQASRRDVPAEERLQALVSSIHRALHDLGPRLASPWPECIRRWCDVLTAAGRTLGTVPVAAAHGDLMRDNIMADVARKQVYLIDWERCQERFYWYDHLAYSLDSRFPRALSERLLAFAGGQGEHWAWQHLPRDGAWRRAALALFLLEELAANLNVNATSPLYGVAEDFLIYLSELHKLGPTLQRLLGDLRAASLASYA